MSATPTASALEALRWRSARTGGGVGKRKQADHRADTRGGALCGLPHAVADSPAYLSLSPFERAVLAEILRRFNGYNNGDIGITYEGIGARLKGANACPPNNGRIARAIAALMERGLIGEPTPESWLQRKARTYRLTFITSGKAPPFRSATNDYLKWTPRVKNDGDAGSPEKARSGDARSPGGSGAGDSRSPADAKNGSFALPEISHAGDAGSLLICKPYGGAEKTEVTPPQIADDPISAAPEAEELRARIAGLVGQLGRGTQGKLARQAKVPAASMSRFLSAASDLNAPARIRLSLAIPRVELDCTGAPLRRGKAA
jgi:hypothetical protein